MCQACKKPDEHLPETATPAELQSVIDCLNARAAENDRLINQLILGALLLILVLIIFALIYPHAKAV